MKSNRIDTKQFRQVMSIIWIMFLIFNTIVLLNNPSLFGALLAGFILGMVIFTLVHNPLIDSMEEIINLLLKGYEDINKIVKEKKEVVK